MKYSKFGNLPLALTQPIYLNVVKKEELLNKPFNENILSKL